MSHFNVVVAIPAEKLRGLTINRDIMEEILEPIMAPYWESTEEPEFLKFVDCTETCKKEYLTDTCDFVKLPDGTVCTTGDRRFYSKYEIFEDSVCAHREKFTDTPVETEDSRNVVLIRNEPVANHYSFEEYCSSYCGYKKNAANQWGYYNNPNAEWDWYEIGGRWSGSFLAKKGLPDAIYAPETLPPDDPSLVGSAAIDGARKKDILWDDMHRIIRKKAEHQYFRLVHAFESKKIDDLNCISTIKEDGIYGWGDILYKAGESLNEYLKRVGLADDIRGSFCPYAFVDKDGQWHSQGEMGWFGLSSGDMPAEDWNKEFNAFIGSLSPDDFIVSVDCHI